jgi:hypothetical protein
MIVRYVRDKDRRPLACVIIDHDLSDEVGKFYYGWSKCHKNDDFSKKMARTIAWGRLVANKTQAEENHAEVKIPYVIVKVLEFYKEKILKKLEQREAVKQFNIEASTQVREERRGDEEVEDLKSIVDEMSEIETGELEE